MAILRNDILTKVFRRPMEMNDCWANNMFVKYVHHWLGSKSECFYSVGISKPIFCDQRFRLSFCFNYPNLKPDSRSKILTVLAHNNIMPRCFPRHLAAFDDIAKKNGKIIVLPVEFAIALGTE